VREKNLIGWLVSLLKNKIKENFSAAAVNYAYNAEIQAQVCERLFLQVKPDLFPGIKIVDLGCGTGFFGEFCRSLDFEVELLQVDFSDEMLIEAKKNNGYEILNCDIEKLEPLAADLIVSSMAVQWCDLGKFLEGMEKFECKKVIYTLGNKSFREVEGVKFIELLSLDEIKKIAGSYEVDSFEIVKKYDSIFDFFSQIKNVGAYLNNMSREYLGKESYKKLQTIKEVSWEIVRIFNMDKK
jgi:ubiquinone/menaquinone biosynthesis C-methylase UbiE